MERNDQMFQTFCIFGSSIEIKALPCNNPNNNVISAPWKCTTQYWMTLRKSSICAVILSLPLKNKNKMHNLKISTIEKRA